VSYLLSKLLAFYLFASQSPRCSRAGKADIWASRIRSIESVGVINAGGRTMCALREAPCCTALVNASSGRLLRVGSRWDTVPGSSPAPLTFINPVT
jgi:hypothetical protein